MVQDICYGIDLIEEMLEEIIVGLEAIKGFMCPFCRHQTVHRMFRENPDGSYDDIGLKCKTCNKPL